ncbi:MAG: ATP-dependent helicase, partial [Pseudomonadota bacterium]
TLARWNRGEIRVLAANPASAGHGLNAQKGGNILVWYSYPNWDLELYEQFKQRLIRQGQKESVVLVHHLIVPGTNDERVLESLKAKDRQQRRLFDALSQRVAEVLQAA